MEKTLFSWVDSEDIINAFKSKGFYYNDSTYINIYRWLWNEKSICPEVTTFPGSKKCRVGFFNPILDKTEYFYSNDFDDMIIKSINYIYEHIDVMIPKKEELL